MKFIPYKKIFLTALFLLPSLFLFSCRTTQFEQSHKHADNFSALWNDNQSDFWTKRDSYFYTCDFFLEDEKTICHAVKIDLTSPELLISLYPDSTDITEKNNVTKIKSVKASSLAKKNDIVINTTQWSQKIPLISEKVPVGIIQNNGTDFSPADRKYDAIAFYKNINSYSARIFSQKNISDFSENAEFISGGFWQILSDSEIVNFREFSDSRTSLGISKDQKTLYILIAEGERKSRSRGLSYKKCAEILSKMGSFNAIEFDGGSSTTLFINKKNVLSYKKNPKLPSFLCFSKLTFDK